jgi:hypothetical protein
VIRRNTAIVSLSLCNIKGDSMNKRFLAVLLCVVAATSQAADLVVNIDGTFAVNGCNPSCVWWAPLVLHLDAGSYTATPVESTFSGAKFTAYSFGGVPGYSSSYGIALDRDHAQIFGTWGPYDTPAIAFSHSAIGSFSLATASDVYFGVQDSYYGDNGGGVSLLLTTNPVPEPETYAMLLAGLSLLGFVARRRKQKEAAA